MTPETSYRQSLHGYTVGFLSSLFITLDIYLITTRTTITGRVYTALIIGFACMQLLVQLVFFLHLSRKSASKWNLLAVMFGCIIVLIIAIGSLWIMHDLDYRMMHDPHGTETYLIHDEGF